MKILADENCEREIVQGLRSAGHDVVTILDTAPSIGDERIFGLAQAEGRILLTNDLDFGLIAERAAHGPPAVVLMRLERLRLERRIEIVVRTFAEIGEGVGDQFIVIEPYQVRVRTYEP